MMLHKKDSAALVALVCRIPYASGMLTLNSRAKDVCTVYYIYCGRTAVDDTWCAVHHVPLAETFVLKDERHKHE